MPIGVFLFGAAAGWALDRCIRRYFSAEDAPISSRALWTALAAGACFVWAQARFGWSGRWMAAALFGAFLLAIARVDCERQLILDRMLLPLAALGVGMRLLAADAGAGWSAPVLGAAAGGAALLLVALASPGGMGGGDIKFAAVLGLWFGWQGVLLVLYGAFLTGGLVGTFLLLTGRKGRRDPVPFGPFLAAAAWLQYLYGAQIEACLAGILL